MRVLHVVASSERRGAELFASDLVGALNEQGIDQRVAILHGSTDGQVSFDAPTIRFPNRGWRLPGVNIQTGIKSSLNALVASWQPDIIQAHGGEAMKYAVSRIRRRRTKVVYRRIGAAPEWITKGFRRAAYGHLIRRTDRVVAVADSLRRETIDMFRIPSDHVITIANSVEPGRIAPQKATASTRLELGVPPDALITLSLGALRWEKDPLTHVEVMARVLEEVPDVVHLMAGDGPLRGDVDESIRRHGLGGRIRLLGVRQDVGDLLAATDVLLFASRPGGMEGMPACVIEAGMAGVPVVSYAVAGIPEVVVDGVTGLLAPYGEVQGLADRLISLLQQEDRRREMGAASRARCRTEFDIGAAGARYIQLYREVIRR